MAAQLRQHYQPILHQEHRQQLQLTLSQTITKNWQPTMQQFPGVELVPPLLLSGAETILRGVPLQLKREQQLGLQLPQTMLLFISMQVDFYQMVYHIT